PRPHHLPRMRAQAEDAEAAHSHRLRSFTGAVSRALGAAGRLSDGRGELFQEAQFPGPADRPWDRRTAALTPPAFGAGLTAGLAAGWLTTGCFRLASLPGGGHNAAD